MAEAVLFFLVGALALAAALGVVLARNPVHSALLLVVVLVAIAVFLVMLDAQLVAAVQVIVYAGAIVVLFLFVIMLLGVDRTESLEEPLRFQRPAAVAIGLLVLVEVLVLTGHQWATGAEASRGALHAGTGTNVERVARSIFTTFLWPFEVLAVLLVAAVLGSVVLARRSRPAGRRPGSPTAGDRAPTAREESPTP